MMATEATVSTVATASFSNKAMLVQAPANMKVSLLLLELSM